MVYTKTIIHLSVGVSGGYLPALRWIIVSWLAYSLTMGYFSVFFLFLVSSEKILILNPPQWLIAFPNISRSSSKYSALLFGNVVKHALSCLTIYIKHDRQCFIGMSKHLEESWKYDAQRSIFNEIRGVWIADETLSRVFDISSQSKQNERVNGRVKSSKSMLIKTGYPNLLHGCDFLCLNLMNY